MSRRLQTIDFLRGLVMIIMALDHVREFFTNAQFNPTDLAVLNFALNLEYLAATTAPYFLTRWITHFCAPVFSYLTGVGAFLWYSRGHSKPELTRFLFTRGAWLIFLELTVTRCLGWAFNFDYRMTLAGVLWILGWSMIVLGFTVKLPNRIFTAIALATIAGHNALGAIRPAAFGRFAWLWKLLHSPGNIAVAGDHNFFTSCVLIPWFAVMMAGFSLGPVFLWEPERRKRFLIRLGAGATTLFVLIRGLNGYGDPAPSAPQKSALFTLFSFVNCSKYPPSLDYLLMTLGPSLLLLGLLDRLDLDRLRPVIVFGRVPLFYYMLHIPLMHLAAVVMCEIRFGDAHWLFTSRDIGEFPSQFPPGWGFSLPIVYLIWATLILALYPLCRWFAGVKERSRSNWLSYL